MKTRTVKSIITFIIAVTLGTLIISLSMSLKATARESYFSADTDEAEISFRHEVKDILKSIGAKNAGVTMTKTCEDGHHLNYEVKINLPGYINESEKAKAYEELSLLKLAVGDSSVSFLFTGKEE